MRSIIGSSVLFIPSIYHILFFLIVIDSMHAHQMQTVLYQKSNWGNKIDMACQLAYLAWQTHDRSVIPLLGQHKYTVYKYILLLLLLLFFRPKHNVSVPKRRRQRPDSHGVVREPEIYKFNSTALWLNRYVFHSNEKLRGTHFLRALTSTRLRLFAFLSAQFHAH